ncbi:MAG: hypothetical protein K5873_00635 [Treponema sp.]|nr:hypothetical protein [Treponema sp.]
MKIAAKVSIMTAFIMVAFFVSCGSTANMDSSSSSSYKGSDKPNSLGSTGGIMSGSGDSAGSIRAGKETDSKSAGPERLTEAPKFDFTGDALKIEAENMYYDGFDLVSDSNASASYGLKLLNESSWAIAEINFPAGSYEGLVNVLAPDSEHSRFTVNINKDSYLAFGSEPPIGKYELTTRSPVSFTLDQATTVTLKIQQNSLNNPDIKGQNGMTLDYVTFKKVK